jgi:hypothetical protein
MATPGSDNTALIAWDPLEGNPRTKLELKVQDGNIIISLPGTSYSVTYYKPKQSPQLLAKYIVGDDDPRVAMNHSEFLAAAWRLANQKARSLGWVV